LASRSACSLFPHLARHGGCVVDGVSPGSAAERADNTCTNEFIPKCQMHGCGISLSAGRWLQNIFCDASGRRRQNPLAGQYERLYVRGLLRRYQQHVFVATDRGQRFPQPGIGLGMNFVVEVLWPVAALPDSNAIKPHSPT